MLTLANWNRKVLGYAHLHGEILILTKVSPTGRFPGISYSVNAHIPSRLSRTMQNIFDAWMFSFHVFVLLPLTFCTCWHRKAAVLSKQPRKPWASEMLVGGDANRTRIHSCGIKPLLCTVRSSFPTEPAYPRCILQRQGFFRSCKRYTRRTGINKAVLSALPFHRPNHSPHTPKRPRHESHSPPSIYRYLNVSHYPRRRIPRHQRRLPIALPGQ